MKAKQSKFDFLQKSPPGFTGKALRL